MTKTQQNVIDWLNRGARLWVSTSIHKMGSVLQIPGGGVLPVRITTVERLAALQKIKPTRRSMNHLVEWELNNPWGY